MEQTFFGVIAISPINTKRQANHYLSRNISTGIYADDPVLLWGEIPRWQLSLSLRLPGLPSTEIPGAIEINASTGELITLPADKLNLMLEMANDIAQRLTLNHRAA